MRRTCQLCPTPVRNFRSIFCADCKRQRVRAQNSMSKRRAGVKPRPADDFTAEQIEVRYQRAVAQKRYEAAMRSAA